MLVWTGHDLVGAIKFVNQFRAFIDMNESHSNTKRCISDMAVVMVRKETFVSRFF